MSIIEADLPPQAAKPDRDIARPPTPVARPAPQRRCTLALSITAVVVAVAVLLTWATWQTYMATPWTRDGTVRAYILTMAPEVAGRIVELPVTDNQFVHKGDLLMVVDPTKFAIAVSQAEAAVQQAQASIRNIDAQASVQQAQISASQAQLDQAQAGLVFAQQQALRFQTLSRDGWGTVQNAQQSTSQLHQQEAAVQTARQNLNVAQRQVESLKAQRMSAEASLAQAMAQLHQAQVDLERTRISSPVDGYVTNLLAQLGDFVSVGVNTIFMVDANSFWVDGYFEETNLAPIHVGDAAQI